MQQKWIEGRTAMSAEDSGTWPIIVEIKKGEEQQIEEGWNIEKKELRKIMYMRTI